MTKIADADEPSQNIQYPLAEGLTNGALSRPSTPATTNRAHHATSSLQAFVHVDLIGGYDKHGMRSGPLLLPNPVYETQGSSAP